MWKNVEMRRMRHPFHVSNTNNHSGGFAPGIHVSPLFIKHQSLKILNLSIKNYTWYKNRIILPYNSLAHTSCTLLLLSLFLYLLSNSSKRLASMGKLNVFQVPLGNNVVTELNIHIQFHKEPSATIHLDT